MTATTFEPSVRGFPPVPEVAWVYRPYVAPPTFTDGEPENNKPISLSLSPHVSEWTGQSGTAVTEQLSVAAVPPTGKPAPAIGRVTPDTGAAAGGTHVTIYGSDFTGATAVKFGTASATAVVVVNDGKITATSPAHVAGDVEVAVITPVGKSPGAVFTYT